jgi:plasmid stabilization system protein ParE
MASKPVEFHEAASLEFEAAFLWYFERSERAALHFARSVEEAVSSIAEAPDRFPSGPLSTRRLLIRRFPFTVIYRDLASVTQVLAIAHARRRPNYWKGRL